MRADKVKGLVPEKKDTNGIGIRYDKAFGYNSAISTIGSKELVLDVEEIHDILDTEIYRKRLMWNKAITDDELRKVAKAISSRIEYVLKIKEEIWNI